MKSNFRKISVLLMICSFLFFGPLLSPAFAADPPTMCQFTTVIVNLFNMIIAIFPLAGLAILMFGAFLWATAGADPQKVQRSQQTLTYGVIGLVLGLSAIAVIGTLQMILIGDNRFEWIGDSGVMRVNFCISSYQDDFIGPSLKGSGEACNLDTECDSGSCGYYNRMSVSKVCK